METVCEGSEPMLFKEKFSEWSESNATVASGGASTSTSGGGPAKQPAVLVKPTLKKVQNHNEEVTLAINQN